MTPSARETLSNATAPDRHDPGWQRDAPGVVACPQYLHYYPDDAPPRAPWWTPAARCLNAVGGDALFLAALTVAVALICTTPIATA